MSRRAAPSRAYSSRRCVFSRQPDEAAYVVGEVRHADLHCRSGNPDGSHNQTHHALLMREDVFDRRADTALAHIRYPHAFRLVCPLKRDPP